MELTSKQRAFLRKKAHSIDAVVRIGKEGFSKEVVQSILDVIENRELIKIKILQNSEEEKSDVATKIAEATSAEVAGLIGRTIILYKKNANKDTELFSELKNIR
ncbi:MAG: ribosome assembly RNA-binding protein YhbY [Fusobacteriaceae bacterium]